MKHSHTAQKLLLHSVAIAGILLVSTLSFGEEFRDITADQRVTLPQDFFLRRDYRVQWWYFTGHLFDRTGREFGYELTFFVVHVQKRPYTSRFGVNLLYISHFALTDIYGKTFHYSDVSDSGIFDYAGADDKRLKVWVGDNRLEGSIERMRIRASDGHKAIDLALKPLKGVVAHGIDGYSRKSEDSPLVASLYFSYSALATEGTIRIGEQVYAVTGKSWFDREISSRALSGDLAGWDWFAIQLDDGREVMLYLMRKKDGSIDRYSSGTFIYRDGTHRHLTVSEFTVDVLATYRSRKTGANYPIAWRLRIPSEHIDVRIDPFLQDQEFIALHTTGNYYWEGACRVSGSARGRAYVEMTGYRAGR